MHVGEFALTFLFCGHNLMKLLNRCSHMLRSLEQNRVFALKLRVVAQSRSAAHAWFSWSCLLGASNPWRWTSLVDTSFDVCHTLDMGSNHVRSRRSLGWVRGITRVKNWLLRMGWEPTGTGHVQLKVSRCGPCGGYSASRNLQSLCREPPWFIEGIFKPPIKSWRTLRKDLSTAFSKVFLAEMTLCRPTGGSLQAFVFSQCQMMPMLLSIYWQTVDPFFISQMLKAYP